MKPTLALRHSLLAASSLLAVSSSHAADGTWNSDVTNSLWGTNTNWSGNVIADGSGSTANFTNNITGDRTVRLDGDRTLTSLVFDDSDTSSAGSWTLDNNANTNNNLILAGTTPGITVNALGAGKTATISAIIQGTAGLVKTGTGTLVLTGANTYTGGTTISAGTLIGTGGTGGSLGSGTVTNSAVLTLNYNDQVIANVISGSGSVRTDAGAANRHVFIGSNNSYSGGTFIDVGILRILTNLASGAADLGTGTVTVANGASFEIWAPSAKTVTNNIVLNGATGNAGRPALNQDGGGGLVTLSGTVTLNATSDIGIGGGSSNSMTITGVVSGVGGMIVDERGLTGVNRTLTLSGANTYTGPTTLNGGILKAGVASVANVSGAFGNNSAVTLANVATGPVLDITGFNTQIGSLTGGGTLGGNVTLGAATLTVGGDNTSPAAYAGVISGAGGGVTKIGTGTQILSGTNTYTGTTTINAGTLQIGNGTNTTAAVPSAKTLNGGTLNYNFNAFKFEAGNITLSADSTIGSISSNNSQMIFSTGTFNGAGFTLTINNGANTGALYFNQTFGTALGQINITAGSVGEDGAGGTPLRTAPVTVSSGAGFRTYNAVSINNNFTLNGGSGPGSNGAIYNEGGGVATYTGTVNLASGTSSIGTAGGNIIMSGVLSGTGALTKISANTLTLSNANTYTGGTTVNDGTLFLGSASALGTASTTITGGSLNLGGQSVTNAVSIGAAGTLTGSGSTGAATLAGSVSPGGSVSGLITLASASVAPTSTIALQLAATGTRGVDYDAITVSDSLALDGTITVSLNGLTPANGQSFDIIDSTGLIDVTNFTVATDLILPALGGGLVWDTSAFVSTGVVSISAGGDPYATWAGGAVFDEDDNNDGVDNGLAWMLGAGSPAEIATGRLPAVTQTGGNLEISFTCLKVAGRGTSVLKLQYSKDLGITDAWAGHEVTVPDAAGMVGSVTFTVPTVNGDPDLVDLKASIPASEAAPGTTLFGRLMGVKQP